MTARTGIELPEVLSSDHNIHGFTKQDSPSPEISTRKFADRILQQEFERLIATTLPLRSFLIRLNNQVYFSLLKKSYMNRPGIIVGKEGQLYGYRYITAYNSQRNGKQSASDARASAKRIKRLQRFFTDRGQLFLYVITPSKAECYPQFIPDRYGCKIDQPSVWHRLFVEALKEQGVSYIDGSELIHESLNRFEIPLFPQMGVHWNQLAAAVVTERIVEEIRNSGRFELDGFRYTYDVAHDPQSFDRDYLDLCNLLMEYTYPVAHVSTKPNSSDRPVKIASVNGSFLTLPGILMADGNYASQMVAYWYLNTPIYNVQTIKKSGITRVNPKDYPDQGELYAPLYASDIVILEENMIYIGRGNSVQLHDFIFGGKTGLKP